MEISQRKTQSHKRKINRKRLSYDQEVRKNIFTTNSKQEPDGEEVNKELRLRGLQRKSAQLHNRFKLLNNGKLPTIKISQLDSGKEENKSGDNSTKNNKTSFYKNNGKCKIIRIGTTKSSSNSSHQKSIKLFPESSHNKRKFSNNEGFIRKSEFLSAEENLKPNETA